MNNSISIISKDSSTCIKGILIFLIILGHNMCFTLPMEKLGLMTYLYAFHVQGFFILPFLYGSKSLTKKVIIKNLIRLYWPYLVLVTTLLFGYGAFTHFANFSISNITKLYVCGGEAILRTMCGYAALWFLPAMLCTLILKDIFYQSNKIIKCTLILISAILNINTILNYPIPYYSFVSEWFTGVAIALRFLILGVITRIIIVKLSKVNISITIWISLLLFVIGTVIYFTLVIPHANQSSSPWFKFIRLWMPIVFMIMLCKLQELGNLKLYSIIYNLGQHSLAIYLVSPFIGYLAYFTLLHFNLVCWQTGIIAQIVITTIAYLIAKYIIRGRLKQFIMPRNIEELRTVFSK